MTLHPFNDKYEIKQTSMKSFVLVKFFIIAHFVASHHSIVMNYKLDQQKGRYQYSTNVCLQTKENIKSK